VNNSTNNTTTDGLAPAPRWYILKVAFNREDTIREALEKRIKLSSLKEYFGEILVPTEDVVVFSRDGKKRIKKQKLYPGYLMIQMIINDDTWFLVRETPGIGDFTGTYVLMWIKNKDQRPRYRFVQAIAYESRKGTSKVSKAMSIVLTKPTVGSRSLLTFSGEAHRSSWITGRSSRCKSWRNGAWA